MVSVRAFAGMVAPRAAISLPLLASENERTPQGGGPSASTRKACSAQVEGGAWHRAGNRFVFTATFWAGTRECRSSERCTNTFSYYSYLVCVNFEYVSASRGDDLTIPLLAVTGNDIEPRDACIKYTTDSGNMEKRALNRRPDGST